MSYAFVWLPALAGQPLARSGGRCGCGGGRLGCRGRLRRRLDDRDSAGGRVDLADGDTLERAVAAGLKPRVALDGNDAYPFFARLSDLIITGPTRTNVMDVRLVLVG